MKSFRIKMLLVAVLLLISVFHPVFAEDSGNTLTVCSQNLFRFSENAKRENADKRKKQKQYLITRMKDAGCDVIALQELVGSRPEEALPIALELAKELELRTDRKFRAFAARSNDKYITNGFLVAEDAGTIDSVTNHFQEPMPKLQRLGPAKGYTRGPLSLVLRRPNGTPVTLIGFHFKSAVKGWKDATRTEFETTRMQSAEGVRLMLRRARARFGKEAAVIVLGDRNSPSESATTDIFRGVRHLKDFEEGCRLSSQQTAVCGTLQKHDEELVDLFGYRKRSDSQKYSKGSYRFRGQEQIIDEILVTPNLLPRIRREDGSLAIGFRGQFYQGSDHKLVWAKLRM